MIWRLIWSRRLKKLQEIITVPLRNLSLKIKKMIFFPVVDSSRMLIGTLLRLIRTLPSIAVLPTISITWSCIMVAGNGLNFSPKQLYLMERLFLSSLKLSNQATMLLQSGSQTVPTSTRKLPFPWGTQSHIGEIDRSGRVTRWSKRAVDLNQVKS